ncbi:MAG TPA: glycosyltransferase, partial [Anaerolineales bacterium]
MISGRAGPPRIVFLHYTAPPIVGGVEAVIAEHALLFREAGYPTLIVAGRTSGETPSALGQIALIPEMDSENPVYLEIHHELESGRIPPQFGEMRSRIEQGLEQVIMPDDVVVAHNVLTTHFNLALTSAVYGAVDRRKMAHLIVWCHDISRHVNPLRNEAQYHGRPWDLLRTRIRSAAYVAVSSERRETIAGIFDCPPDLIHVIPNGVNPERLLGLSPLGKHLAAVHGLFSVDLILLMPVRITRAKNFEFALHVVEALRRRGLTVRLVITGPPDPHMQEGSDYYADLRKLRKTLRLQHEVVFVHEGTDRYPAPL